MNLQDLKLKLMSFLNNERDDIIWKQRGQTRTALDQGVVCSPKKNVVGVTDPMFSQPGNSS